MTTKPTKLFAIACDFKLEQNGPTHNGIAICSDPDTVVTFIFPNGKPYLSDEIWTYSLRHYQPWIGLDVTTER